MPERSNLKITFHQVTLHLAHVFNNNNHCLVCALENVYVYCEEAALEIQRGAAKELADILLHRQKKQGAEVRMVKPGM